MSIAKASPKRARKDSDAQKVGFQHRNLPLLLLHAREAVLGQFRPILNELGLTEQQWRIIRALLAQGPMEPREIQQICGFSSPSMAGMLSRMEDLNLITRERQAQDQRRVTVCLTDKSRGLSATLAPRIEAVYSKIENHIGADFATRFYKILDQLIELMGEISDIEE